jgi:hypothetical protein
MLSAFLHPPDGVMEHLPCFQHKEVIEVATDFFRSLEIDLAMYGAPSSAPALGLLK